MTKEKLNSNGDLKENGTIYLLAKEKDYLIKMRKIKGTKHI